LADLYAAYSGRLTHISTMLKFKYFYNKCVK